MIRSMHSDHTNHYNATLGMHTGSFTFARPSIGSWVSYGLGTENRNLPSFVVIAPQVPYAGDQVWGSDFLPGCHQGTRVVPGAEPIPNIQRRVPSSPVQQLRAGLARPTSNRRHLPTAPATPHLAARIRSFETAFGMQREMPEAFDLSRETDATLDLYGLERGQHQGLRLAMPGRPPAGRARRAVRRADRHRLVEQLGLARRHGRPTPAGQERRSADRRPAHGPETRGMLDDTLVVWTTEFGRTPFNEQPQPRAASIITGPSRSWLAGGGVKGGIVHGATDELRHLRRREAGPRPRLPRHDPAPAGPRPHAADLPPRRPRLPPDRRGARSCARSWRDGPRAGSGMHHGKSPVVKHARGSFRPSRRCKPRWCRRPRCYCHQEAPPRWRSGPRQPAVIWPPMLNFCWPPAGLSKTVLVVA